MSRKINMEDPGSWDKADIHYMVERDVRTPDVVARAGELGMHINAPQLDVPYEVPKPELVEVELLPGDLCPTCGHVVPEDDEDQEHEDGDPPAPGEIPPYTEWLKDTLLVEADTRGLDYAANITKPQLVELLEQDDEAADR